MMLKEKWGDQEVIWEEKDLNGGCLVGCAPVIGGLIFFILFLLVKWLLG